MTLSPSRTLVLPAESSHSIKCTDQGKAFRLSMEKALLQHWLWKGHYSHPTPRSQLPSQDTFTRTLSTWVQARTSVRLAGRKRGSFVPGMAPLSIYGAHHGQQAPNRAPALQPSQTKSHQAAPPEPFLTTSIKASNSVQPVYKHYSRPCYGVLVITKAQVGSRASPRLQ